MQSEFRVEIRDEAGAKVVEVGGELDLASSPMLQDEVMRLLEESGSTVLLDLRDLTFMDSTGLSVLVRAYHAAERSGAHLILVKGPPQVQRLLTLTGVGDRFHIVDAPEDAHQQG